MEHLLLRTIIFYNSMILKNFQNSCLEKLLL